jgi:hypothetical protein
MLVVVGALVWGGAAVFRWVRGPADEWRPVASPEMIARDGPHVNAAFVDAGRKHLSLVATGVLKWSPTFSMGESPDGGGVELVYSAAGRVARVRTFGRGPALFVAIADVGADHFDLTDAQYDRLVKALKAAGTGDPDAPLDRPTLVDTLRDRYDGPDRERLLRLLAGYRATRLTEAEKDYWNARDRAEFRKLLLTATTRPATGR